MFRRNCHHSELKLRQIFTSMFLNEIKNCSDGSYFYFVQRLGRQCERDPPYLKIQDAWANPKNEVGKNI